MSSMAASQYHFNTINREYSKFSRASIQILFFTNLYHLNNKSKENLLNMEVHEVFLLTFILHVFLRTMEIA